MQQHHRNAVLHERPPQTAQAMPEERHAVAEVLFLEAIPADKEEQRHMEHIDDVAWPDVKWKGMADHHQDDGHPLNHADNWVSSRHLHSLYILS